MTILLSVLSAALVAAAGMFSTAFGQRWVNRLQKHRALGRLTSEPMLMVGARMTLFRDGVAEPYFTGTLRVLRAARVELYNESIDKVVVLDIRRFEKMDKMIEHDED